MVRLKMRNPKHLKNNPRWSKKFQEKLYKIKVQLMVAFDHWKYWKYWKYQTHWKQFKYVMQIKIDTNKKTFVCLITNSL